MHFSGFLDRYITESLANRRTKKLSRVGVIKYRCCSCLSDPNLKDGSIGFTWSHLGLSRVILQG